MKLERHRRISPSVTEHDAKETVLKFIPCVLKVGVQVSPSDDHVGSDKVCTVTEIRGASKTRINSSCPAQCYGQYHVSLRYG